MKKLFLIFALLLTLATPAYAQTCVYFFWGQGCPHCARAGVFLEDFVRTHPDVKIVDFEIYQNTENRILLLKYFDAYNVPENARGVPALFVGEQYLVGDRPIIENLESVIEEVGPVGCPSLTDVNGLGQTGSTSPLKAIGPEFFAVIIGAALVDSINPCAIAVLLILLGALLVAAERKQALKAGLAFTLSIYISYFLFGLGLFSALQISGISYLFYQVIGLFAILIGVLNIKDFLWYGGGGFVMEIPRTWRPKLRSMLKKVTSPGGAFLMGFLVCLFELPCTGGPYLFVLGLLAERTTQAIAIGILLFYNFIFVLPLILISFAMYHGYTTIERAGKWKEKNIRLLHLLAGVVMCVLGLAVIAQWV